MVGGSKSHALPVVGTWAMYLKAKVFQLPQMNAIVSIVYHLSLLLQILPCKT